MHQWCHSGPNYLGYNTKTLHLNLNVSWKKMEEEGYSKSSYLANRIWDWDLTLGSCWCIFFRSRSGKATGCCVSQLLSQQWTWRAMEVPGPSEVSFWGEISLSNHIDLPLHTYLREGIWVWMTLVNWKWTRNSTETYRHYHQLSTTFHPWRKGLKPQTQRGDLSDKPLEVLQKNLIYWLYLL